MSTLVALSTKFLAYRGLLFLNRYVIFARRGASQVERKVYLRVLEFSDLQKTHQWMNEPELNELMGCMPFNARQQEKWFDATIDNKTKFIFAICRTLDDEHIGNIGLNPVDYVNSNAMLSIFIADNKKRSQGMGFEAIIQALEFSFHRLNLHKVFLKTSDHLAAAIAFYKKVGFVEEGLLREHEFKGGKFINKRLLSILRSEFDERYE